MTFKTTLLAGVALACLATAGSAQTLRWGAARDINSLDSYSYGSTFTISLPPLPRRCAGTLSFPFSASLPPP